HAETAGQNLARAVRRRDGALQIAFQKRDRGINRRGGVHHVRRDVAQVQRGEKHHVHGDQNNRRNADGENHLDQRERVLIVRFNFHRCVIPVPAGCVCVCELASVLNFTEYSLPCAEYVTSAVSNSIESAGQFWLVSFHLKSKMPSVTVPLCIPPLQFVVTRLSFKIRSATRAAAPFLAPPSPARLATCSASTAVGMTMARNSSAASTSASVKADA